MTTSWDRAQSLADKHKGGIFVRLQNHGDKIVARIGPAKVALITGEERIKPDNPRYYVCTVEAMPRDIDVEFVAVDEIQLAADPDRGHVFTERLFSAPSHPYTQALLSAAPELDPTRRSRTAAVRGELPSPVAIPPGCPFHPRCPHVFDPCRRLRPELLPGPEGGLAACHLVARQEIRHGP